MSYDSEINQSNEISEEEMDESASDKQNLTKRERKND